MQSAVESGLPASRDLVRFSYELADLRSDIALRRVTFMRFCHNATRLRTHMNKTPESRISASDAMLLGGAIVGVLMGLSMLSFQIAVGVGVLALGYVVVKLLTT